MATILALRTLRTAAEGLHAWTGIDMKRVGSTAIQMPRYLRDLVRYQTLRRDCDEALSIRSLMPILGDYNAAAGQAQGHYFWQDLWAAKKIFAAVPDEHIDVGSRVDGFISHLLVFRAVKVVDIRPLQSKVPGLQFLCADATNMDGIPDNSVESLSSLHAVEHFGLGRYGDTVDPAACFKIIRALTRVLRPGGKLYFSVPIGRERVEFNAHRVFAPQTVIRSFNSLRLLSFAAVNDTGDFFENALPSDFNAARYACGLFEFTKPE